MTEPENEQKPDLLNCCARTRIVFAAFHTEFGKYPEAIMILEASLNILQSELSVRLSKQTISHNPAAATPKTQLQDQKINKCVRMLALVLVDLGVCHEMLDNYPKTLESLRCAEWFCESFLTNEDFVSKHTRRLLAETKKKVSYIARCRFRRGF